MNTPRERDQSVERLIRESFNTLPQALTDSCLDAETLAAWVDGGLTADAAAIARAHVADCARCQGMAATLVRTSPITPTPEPSPRRWFAWLVPLTAAAAAVAIWIAVPRNPGVPSSVTTSGQEQAAATVQEPASLDKVAQPPSANKDESIASREATEGKEPLPAAERATQAAGAVAKSDQSFAPEVRRDSGQREADRLEPQQKASAPVDALADAAQQPASPPPAALAAPQAARSRAANGLAERVAASVEIVSPDPAVRWRIAGSLVERSIDRGSTWTAVPVPVASELLAGAAPSATVSWIVGRAGVVLLTTDRATFSRVSFPETTDLSAVRATDARSATVTTADGRTFRTADAGATWTQP